MILNISIDEAVDIIKARTHKPISMRIVNSNTINVGYEVSVKIPLIGNRSKTISVDLIIDNVTDSDIYIHYSTGIIGGDSLINALLSYFPAINNSKVVEACEDGHIMIHLNELDQLKGMLEKIEINSISFGDDDIMVDFNPLF